MIRILQKENRVTKIIFAGIIGVAVVSMVAYLIPGINDGMGGGADGTVFATVHEPGAFGRFMGDTQTVKQADVTRLAQQQLQQQKLPPFLLPYVETQAGHMLVQRAMLKQEADRLGLQVSDADLRRELQIGPFAQYLFPNGEYIGDDKYMDFVQSAFNLTRSDFEYQVKQDMEMNRLQALVTGGVNVSDNAVRDSYRISGTKVKFDYAAISAEDLRKTINPTDAELQTFFKDNKTRYATAIPETRKLTYFAFDANALPGGKPKVTDADIQKYYADHKADYDVKEQVKVRHILVAVPASADAKTDAAGKAKAEDALKQIKAGGDWTKIAASTSDDPGSKGQGGELGWLDRGKTVPEFDKTAFSLKPGEISGVFKTQFGYHFLQVEEKKDAHTKPLEEVKPEIVPVLEQQMVGAAEAKLSSDLVAEASKTGIDKTAAAHNLHAQTTDYLAKDGVVAGVADGAQLLTQAFTTAKGAPPASVSTGDGFAIFQVVDIKAAHAPSFDEYKQHIADDFREQKVPQLLNSQLEKLATNAKVYNDLRKAAAEMNIPVKSSDLVGKDGQVPDLGAMSGPGSVAFSLAKGAISGPINAGRVGVVLTITDKQEPTAEEIAKNFNATKDQLLNEQHEEIFKVFVGSLTDKYEKANAVKYTKKQPAPGASPFGN
ncbi:peptidyl-prolyl cis-trans isomerase D [Granulicella rosea]|uniref:Periplasmic chaperone PpiD n=1 Tax=Granulicella rosea TaxID=474952 RepID=A0A239HEY0_9BACT|nr:peptidyl-prolyl cis-trans isomerase [Granulicella rosea]SNS79937.1 peptidyl-prolyl cis-trans isomerase D [Granulicella rosea]